MNKKRCKVCNIKLSLDGWNCKCDSTLFFCTKHRYPFEHNCSFDFKLKEMELLQSKIPKVVHSKVDPI